MQHCHACNTAGTRELAAIKAERWDVAVIGSGMGGLTAAATLASLGKKVLPQAGARRGPALSASGRPLAGRFRLAAGFSREQVLPGLDRLPFDSGKRLFVCAFVG